MTISKTSTKASHAPVATPAGSDAPAHLETADRARPASYGPQMNDLGSCVGAAAAYGFGVPWGANRRQTSVKGSLAPVGASTDTNGRAHLKAVRRSPRGLYEPETNDLGFSADADDASQRPSDPIVKIL